MNVVAVVTLLLLVAGPRAQGLVNARDSLGGLSGFRIVVEVDEGARLAGVAGSAIAAQVEARLRASGVQVSGHAGKSAAGDPATPGVEGQLRVDVVAVSGAAGGEAFAAVRYDVAISQWAVLDADPAAAVFARTWAQGGVLAAPRAQVGAVLRDALAPVLDSLCSDYAAGRAYWLARDRLPPPVGEEQAGRRQGGGRVSAAAPEPVALPDR